MQKGFWCNESSIAKTYPYLAHNEEGDVVIVGGGLSGAITAFFLAKEGYKIAVVEKNIVGYAKTGICAGIVSDFTDELLVKSFKDLRENTKLSILNLSSKAHKLLDEIAVDIKDLELLEKVDLNIINTKLFSKGIMQEETKLRHELGQKAEFAKEVCEVDIKKHARLIDPYRLTLEIMSYISQFPNVRIYENTRVKNITEEEGDIVVESQNGFKIKSKSIIFTTPIDYLGIDTLSYIDKYRRFEIVADTDMTQTRCIKLLNDIPLYIRIKDGKCIVTGLDLKYIARMEDKKYIEDLEEEQGKRLIGVVKKLYPHADFSNVVCFSGNIYKSKDNLPIISEIEDFPNAYLNLGMGSSSIEQVLIGASILKEALKGYYPKDMNYFKLLR